MRSYIAPYHKPHNLKGIPNAVVKCGCSEISETQIADNLCPIVMLV